MRFLLQRVSSAQVDVGGQTVGKIGAGICMLAGFGVEDQDLPGSKVWNTMLNKVLDLRIFPDDQDSLNLSVRQTGGEVLVVSQFTLYAECRKGRRPSFSNAAPPVDAEKMYDALVQEMEMLHPGKIGSGQFGAMMDVSLVNWGPVTIMLDSVDFS